MPSLVGCLVAVAIVTFDGTVAYAQIDAAPQPNGGSQTYPEVTRAADLITAEAIARHVGVMAHDSMAGRATPSLGLTQTAQYVAAQFRAFGLQPRVGTPWVQEYPIIASAMTLDDTASRLYCTVSRSSAARREAAERGSADSGTGDDTVASTTYASGAYFAVDTALEAETFRQRTDEVVVAVTGRQTLASVEQADVRGRVVLYLPTPNADSVTERQVLQALYAANRVLVLSRQDSGAFARRQRIAASRPILAIDQERPSEAPRDVQHWAAYLQPAALGSCLTRAGADLIQWQSDTLPKIRELPGLTIWSAVRPAKVTEQRTTAMNVVGMVPANVDRSTNDTSRRRPEGALVITAHMDHGDAGHDRADPSGANDNASGVAALLELAKAFGQLEPRARPRRPIVFLATSGEPRLAGATFWLDANAAAPASLAERSVIANVNLDMLGRPAGDSVWVDGMRDADWAVRLDWLTALHPELRLRVIDGGSIIRPGSDHFAFVRQAIPSLHFYDDTHDNPVFAATGPTALEPARTARIAKLVFHLMYELADAPRPPRWTPEGRRQRLAMFDQP